MFISWFPLFILVGLYFVQGWGSLTSDGGGNFGWGVSSSSSTQYASVPGYFRPATYWPINNITGYLQRFIFYWQNKT